MVFFFFQNCNFSLIIKRSFSIGIFLPNLTGANVQSLKGFMHCSDIVKITSFWFTKKAFKASLLLQISTQNKKGKKSSPNIAPIHMRLAPQV